MHVLILGGGVVGVTSAWYLARAGAGVTVVDRQPAVAMETSFANAGQLSFGYASPWAAPGIPLMALRWLLQRHAPLAIRPTADLHQYCWLVQLLRNCTAARYAINKERMVRLAEYSRHCLDQLQAETGIRYEQRRLGTTQLFRSQQQLDAAAQDMRVLAATGTAYELLDRDGIARVEPALTRVLDRLVGALHLPTDQTGDCQLFTERLAELARGKGVLFRFGTTIQRLLVEGGELTGVEIDGERVRADHYVVALGSYSPLLLKSLGLKLPVYPLKGYSLTVPIRDADAAPRSTILDETYKVAITRFDQRIRVGGMAEVAGYDLALKPRRRESLKWVLNDLFPAGGEPVATRFWAGLRAATPDGTPVIGPTHFRNLWLNTGHGTLGWTMACGSARVLADQLAGRTPEISTEGLSIARYRRD
ncbi:MAG: D-amino acid dehydrogenase [Spongiibacteraceae bacterium]|jgi:D-amino-acid dehydrogenase|nr:D-amino acid dehydrogenase [Spongiibacteraceae bacterium]